MSTLWSLGFVFGLAMVAAVGGVASAQSTEKPSSALDFHVKSIDGKAVDLSIYRGNVLLIVNVASKCGLTPQYEQLQALHKKYEPQGFAVLAFPCNQFGQQEPGAPEEIKQFCKVNYGVTFPLFEKIEVNGDGAAPLYKYLTSLQTRPSGPGKITWNFEKFVVGRDGQVVARFAPRTKPDDPELLKIIEAELDKK